MAEIISSIVLYNTAFDVAWKLSLKDDRLGIGAAPRLSAEVSRLIKAGSTDAGEIGQAAYLAVFGPRVSGSDL